MRYTAAAMMPTRIPADYRPAPNLLASRVILVTGAGDGLGRAAALAYARHGATVILLGRTQKKLEAVYDQIEAERLPRAWLMPADLAHTTLGDFEKIAGAIENEYGRLDGLLHSAAILGTLTPLNLYPLDTWMQVMQVNLNAAYLLTRACLPLLAKSDSSVIFTTADVARERKAYWGAYAVAGAALESLARIWASELENTSIRVSTLDPGAVRTKLRAAAFPGEPTAQLTTPESVVGAYLYLMGPDSIDCSGGIFLA